MPDLSEIDPSDLPEGVTMDDLERLKQKQRPTGWRPAEGDAVTGTVEKVEKFDLENDYEPYYAYTIDGLLIGSDGRVVEQTTLVHAFHKMLRESLDDVSEGDHVEIKYHGRGAEKEGTEHSPPHIYSVFVNSEEIT